MQDTVAIEHSAIVISYYVHALHSTLFQHSSSVPTPHTTATTAHPGVTHTLDEGTHTQAGGKPSTVGNHSPENVGVVVALGHPHSHDLIAGPSHPGIVWGRINDMCNSALICVRRG